MWTLASADLPSIASCRTKRPSPGEEVARPMPSAAPSASTVLSSTRPTSVIAGGQAESYDGVRGMLCSQAQWRKEQEEVLLQPYNHLASRPGKEVRSQIIDALNIWLEVPEDKVAVIRKVVGMLHTSSLLIDDVEDDSVLRRGAPVAHSVYGVPQTINTANYVYFLVFAEILAMKRSDGGEASGQERQVEEMIVEEMLNLHRGQGMDLYWRDHLVCPTEEEYVEMVNNKTSGLLRIVIKLMVAYSPVMGRGEDKEVLVPLVNLIGLLFQIRDDFMNLRSGDYAENKGYCEDITEGKFSFPIIHSVRASKVESGDGEGAKEEQECGQGAASEINGNGTQPAIINNQHHLLYILQSRPMDAETKRVVIDYMDKQTHSFDYTCSVMARLDKLVQDETTVMEARLGGGKVNVRLRGILDALRKGWFQQSEV